MRFALLNGGIRVFVVHGIPYISVCCFMRSAKSFVCFPVPPPQLWITPEILRKLVEGLR